VFFEKVEKKNMQEMMMTNPEFMQGMMKQQLGGLLPQVRRRRRLHCRWRCRLCKHLQHPASQPTTHPLGPPPATDPARIPPVAPTPTALQLALGAMVNFFFSGFILGRIPFALSPKFRIMLQRGIDLPALDPSYFTSLSYYLLLLFGLRGVLTLLFRCAGRRGLVWAKLEAAEGRGEGWQRLRAWAGAELSLPRVRPQLPCDACPACHPPTHPPTSSVLPLWLPAGRRRSTMRSR
jgi:hypothetical protein